MDHSLNILIIEDSEDDTQLLLREVSREGYAPVYKRVDSRDDMLDALTGQPWDVIVSDFQMPGFTGMEALAVLRNSGFDIPFILVSGTVGEEVAVQAMKRGANDYLAKRDLTRLVPAIERELKEAQVRRERRQAEERLHHLAYYDALTGLPNRALLGEYLDHTTEAEPMNPLAVFMLRLTYLNEINFTLGHYYGDMFVSAAADRLRKHLNDVDLLSHIGNGRFVILMRPENDAHVEQFGSELINTLKQSFDIADLSLGVGPAIGIALYPDHGNDGQTLLRRSDIALNQLHGQSHRAAVYMPDRDPSSPKRLALLSDLRSAIDNGEIELYYQPKINSETNRVTGFEALARWHHAKYGMVPPVEFIELAERTGMIDALTQHVIDSATLQIQRWQELGLRLPIAVNLSTRNLLDESLIRKLETLHTANVIIPGMLELEITETSIMEEADNAMAVLTRLATLGMDLYIDDFGTGYSSLGYLNQLPVKAVKIDRSFVTDFDKTANSRTIVHAIVNLANNLGLRVVAEGVEDQNTMDALGNSGCHEIQGYHISRPLPLPELEKWLKTTHYQFDQLRLDSGMP